jgi:uncharacterized protein (UPF0276 family)
MAFGCRLAGRSRSTGTPRTLKSLVDRYEPALVSEHLAWSTHDATYFNELLPRRYAPATVSWVADHLDEVEEAIGCPLLLENPSTFLPAESDLDCSVQRVERHFFRNEQPAPNHRRDSSQAHFELVHVEISNGGHGRQANSEPTRPPTFSCSPKWRDGCAG